MLSGHLPPTASRVLAWYPGTRFLWSLNRRLEVWLPVSGKERRHQQGTTLPRGVLHCRPQLGAGRSGGCQKDCAGGGWRTATVGSKGPGGTRYTIWRVGNELDCLQPRSRCCVTRVSRLADPVSEVGGTTRGRTRVFSLWHSSCINSVTLLEPEHAEFGFFIPYRCDSA
jgi:hypothetical protein